PAADLVALLAAVLRGEDPTNGGEIALNALIKLSLDGGEEGLLLNADGVFDPDVASDLQDALGEFLVLERTEANGTSLHVEVQPGELVAPSVISAVFVGPDIGVGTWEDDNSYVATVSVDFASDVLIG